MSIKKKSAMLYIVAVIALVMICSGVLYAFSGACEVINTDRGIYHSIKASFIASRVTNGAYYTSSGKHIKKCYVRLQEKKDGKITKDTGRVYSSQASSAGDTKTYSTYKLMFDHIGSGYITYAYWGWYYF